MNLYEFKPHKPPGAGTYWPTTDFEDICSGFLNSEGLPDGKYKIKLEILDKNGVLIMPNTLYKFVVPIKSKDSSFFIFPVPQHRFLLKVYFSI